MTGVPVQLQAGERLAGALEKLQSRRATIVTDNRMKQKERKVVHRAHYDNHLVEVIDQGDKRSLVFAGSVVQSTMSKKAPDVLTLSYTSYMMTTLMLNQLPEKVLVVGLGAGSLLRFLNYHFPDCRIDAIDSVAEIITLAREYFQLPDKSEISIHCRDGYEFLADLPADYRYDLILVDAFDAKGMAKTVYRPDFFDLCREHLTLGGTISLNLWSGNRDRMDEVVEAVGSCFTAMVKIPVPKRGNVICLARNDAPIWPMLRKNRPDLAQLSKQFSIDFKSIINVCRKNNLSLFQRLSHRFNGNNRYH